MKQSPSPSRFTLGLGTVVTAGALWALLSFVLAATFGVPVEGETMPRWYVIVGYILDGVAYLGAACLCLRNWLCQQLMGDRNVWLWFGIRSGLYLVANFFFAYWELVLRRFPEVSLADPFYIASYGALLWGLFLAIRSRRLYLKTWHYIAIALLVIVGIWLGWLSSAPAEANEATLAASSGGDTGILLANAVPQKPPRWAYWMEKRLAPLESLLNLLHVVSDVLLLVLTGLLLIIFWGGRLVQTRTVIASAALLLYLADIGYAYGITHGNLSSGGLLDTLWVTSGILFGIGAALEYDISNRLRSRQRS
jgi:hypothetical protein